jgi:hypothetical protein
VAFRRKQSNAGHARRGGCTATLVGAIEKPLAELAGAAANPMNIPLDIQTVTDLKAVWPQLEAFLKTLGVKF